MNFTVNVTLTDCTASTLDAASQDAVVDAVAQSMYIGSYQVHFDYSFPMGNTSETSFTVGAVMTVSVYLGYAWYSNPADEYYSLTNDMNYAFSSGDLTNYIQSYSYNWDAEETYNAVATAVAYSPYTTSTPPAIENTLDWNAGLLFHFGQHLWNLDFFEKTPSGAVNLDASGNGGYGGTWSSWYVCLSFLFP